MSGSWSFSFSFSFGLSTRDRSGGGKEIPGVRPATPQPQSQILSLPIELRMVIYEYLFHLSDSGLILRRCNSRRHRHPQSVLSILQTCRQVLQEAEEIFFAINRFRYDQSTTPQFLCDSGPTRRDAVASLAMVAASGLNAYQLLPELSRIPNLQSLYIERSVSIRFLNLREWTSMVIHIRKILVQMKHLEEVKMITPLPKDMVEWEKKRLAELETIDYKLRNFRDPSIIY